MLGFPGFYVALSVNPAEIRLPELGAATRHHVPHSHMCAIIAR
jgi:hypothetical protein